MGASMDDFIHEIILDNSNAIENMIKKHPDKFKPNEYINKDKTFTALNLCSSYGSIKCAKILIQNEWDIELEEKKESNTNLMLACKFGFDELVKLYTEKYNCSLDKKNKNNIDALDISVIYCQYKIAFYLKYTMKMELRSEYNYYQNLIKKLNLNMFNIQKFYNCLISRVDPLDTGSFSISKNTNVDKIESSFGKSKEILKKEKRKQKRKEEEIETTNYNIVSNKNNNFTPYSYQIKESGEDNDDLLTDPHQIDVIEEMKNQQGYINHDILFYKSYQ
jgi:hypothetical protein